MIALLLAAQALTLAVFDRLPPAEAGERALAGQEHGPIVEVIAEPPRGLLPPGVTERELIERAVSVPGGCSRRRWAVEFVKRADAESVNARFARPEIARGSGGRCPTEGYVHVNPGLTEAQAFAALVRLDAIRRPGLRVALTCRDETSSGLCRGEDAVRRALGRLSPWAVTPMEDGTVEAWLGTPGQAVTAVRFAAAGDTAAVARRFAAPF